MPCDVNYNDVFIDLEDAKTRLTGHTKAIMPVHYASDSSNMAKVYDFAAAHNLRVIEDAAHSFGGVRDNKRIGCEGDVVCFSFDGIKNITCGEGGAVVTGDRKLARRIQDARLLGVEKDTEKRYQGKRSWTFDINNQGYRYHMSNLMAAIGREQLKKLDRFSAHRKSCMEYYRLHLQDVNDLVFMALDYKNIVPHICAVKITGKRRDALLNGLLSQNIECGIHYQPNHLLSYYKTGYKLPTSERLFSELISLPLHADLAREEQDRVVAAVKAILMRA